MLTVTPLAIFLVPRRLKTEEQQAINPKSTPNDIEKENKGILKFIHNFRPKFSIKKAILNFALSNLYGIQINFFNKKTKIFNWFNLKL